MSQRGGGGERPGAVGMAGRHSAPGTRDELAPGVLMRALGVGVTDEAAAAGERADPAPSAARARLAVAAVIAGTALLAGVLGPGAGAETNSAESWPNVPARARAGGSVETQGDSFVKTRKFGSDVVLGAAAAAAVSMSALAGDAVQWRVEDGGNGHWYQWLQRVPGRDWNGWRAYAEGIGGHLATITTPAENWFVTGPSVFQGSQASINGGSAFIGAFQPSGSGEPYGDWQWVTGEPFVLDPSQWRSLEDCCGGSYCNNEGEDAAALWSWAGDLQDPLAERKWNDVGKCLDWWGSVIEWSADCNSDGIVDYGQILSGALADANTNDVPDICECATHPELGACRCAGDIVTDGTVNGADLGTLLAYWGPANSGAFSQASDINSDGRIDGSDLGVLLSNWGTCQYPGVTVPAWATLIEAVPDPAVVTDPALRTAIAATGLAWRVRDTATQIEMLLVPPGSFPMGCSEASTFDSCPSLELPVHTVTITSAYYLGRYEVTQSQWQAQSGSNPSIFQGYSDSQSRPVENVSWNAVQALIVARGMRLPTEAEWEYACRAGTTTALYNGSNDDATAPNIGWYTANSANQTRPVGSKEANRLGLYDMAGNVWEWTADWWDGATTPYNANPQTNPSGQPTGSYRAVRGGGWDFTTRYLRSSARGNSAPDGASSQVGFRAARNP